MYDLICIFREHNKNVLLSKKALEANVLLLISTNYYYLIILSRKVRYYWCKCLKPYHPQKTITKQTFLKKIMKWNCNLSGGKTSLFSFKSLNLSKFIYEVEIYFNFKKITDCRVIIRFVNFLLFQLCNKTVMLLATENCLITSIFIFKRIIISIEIKSNSILVCIFFSLCEIYLFHFKIWLSDVLLF